MTLNEYSQGYWRIDTHNSTYLVDCYKKRVKRLLGEHNQQLPYDNEWTNYSSINSKFDEPMRIVWFADGTSKLRVTSNVEAIVELDSNAMRHYGISHVE